jgi:hypothetical protein
VTIFDRRSVKRDRTHLYYVSFYLQSHRFHTKHVLIYTHIGGKKGKNNDKVRKDETSRIEHVFNRDRYTILKINLKI